MTHREPPPSAVWILEHLASGHRDEALAGDLLEVFQSGRSNGWYWRQAMEACGVSWLESIRARTSLLVFALLWSMVAPAWNAVCLAVESDRVQNRFCSLFGGVWIIPALIAWIILHSIFLWGGVLLFSVFHRALGGTLDPGRFKRAFLTAPVIFTPLYGAVFLAVSLYWFSYFERFQLRASPLGQIADLRMLANVIRIPYLLALLWALWSSLPSIGYSSAVVSDPSALNPAVNSGILTREPTKDSFIVKRFFALMVGAGLMNSMIAGFLLCQLPESHSPTIASLCIRAMLYVLIGALAGVGGTYIYWKNPASPFAVREPLPFPLFALVSAGGYLLVPAIVILSEQLSPAIVLVVAIGAFSLTSGLRRILSPTLTPNPHRVAISEQGRAALFIESLYQAPAELYGYAIAISLYAAGVALFARLLNTAAALLALAASVFAWKTTAPADLCLDRDRQYKHAALRLAAMAVLAVLVTVWALLDAVAHRNILAAARSASIPRIGNPAEKRLTKQSAAQTNALGADGYESVILWPYPDKRLALPPIEVDTLLPPGTKKPLVIRFNGPYWYFQPPNKRPGPMAHRASGSPLAFDIQSNNSIPLVMDAHQYLSATIPTVRCREIAVEIENRDNKAGAISLGMLLTDGTSAKRPAIYLGEQPIVSAQPEHFADKPRPVFETVHFSVPEHASLRKFSEITVLVLPDVEHAFHAPRISIEQFQLYPR